MKAMLLAAGRGQRMRPLTDTLPKPLLPVGGKPLIVWQLERLKRAGIDCIVINLSYLGERIVAALGDGARWGVRIRYRWERGGALETGGDIRAALAQLQDGPFLVANADVWTDFPYRTLVDRVPDQAHLVLIDNPAHRPAGDFLLRPDGRLDPAVGRPLTFSGIGVYRPDFIARRAPGRFALAPLLRDGIAEGRVSGEYWPGDWRDIGTPARLAELDQWLRGRGDG